MIHFSKPLTLSLLALSLLSACQFEPQKSPFRERMQAQAEKRKQWVDAPQINPDAFYPLRTPQQKNKYVLEKVESYLQDQLIRSQDFSHRFYMQELNKLPAELVNSYATHYLEKELKIDGFAGYFRRCNTFLLAEAVKGYSAMGLESQAKILAMAGQNYLNPKLPLAKRAKLAQKLNQLWFDRADKIIPRRAAYFSQKIQAWAPQQTI